MRTVEPVAFVVVIRKHVKLKASPWGMPLVARWPRISPQKEAELRTNMSLHVSCEVPCLGIRLVPHVRTMHEAVALGTSRRAVRLLQTQAARHQIVTKE
jgi:hypothetical protein